MADGKKKRKITRQGVQRVTNSFCQAAMIPSALIGLIGGAAYFGTLDADPMKPIMVFTLFTTMVVSVCAYILVV
jgi:phage shock protein PspC (stress-responsive transcriptional regulator)